MQLDNKEAFKKWLIETLNPICEAEPDTLASYIVALVKKERSEAELVELCCRELEVFLLDETKRFVKKLFEALRSKSYLPKSEVHERPKEKVKQPVQLTQYKGLPKRDQERIEDSRGLSSHDSGKRETRPRTSSTRRRSPDHRVRSRASSRRAFESSHSRNKSPPIRLGKRGVREDEEEEDEDVVSMASSRKRNRSDSSGHSVASRTRYWRSRQQSKTPPSNNNNNNSNNNNFKQKCPHYEKGYCKYGDSCVYQHGEDHIVIESSNYPPQSFGTLPAYMPQSALPNLTKPPPALPFSNQFHPPPTINPLPPSFKLPPPQGAQYAQNPYQMPLQQPVQASVQDNFNQYHPEPYVPMPARFNQPPPLLSSSATYLPTDHKQQQLHLHDVNNNNNDDLSAPYNPQNTNIYIENNNNQYNNDNDNNDRDDDDDVSVTSRQSVKRTASEVGLSSQHPSFPDKQVKRPNMADNKNPGMPGKKKNNPGSYQYIPNTVLELRRIPAEDNTISNINSHFSKFGIIVNLQINFDNDPCAALVAFASAAQASAAHKSKEPFLNNRFIRIFWHNPDKANNASASAATALDKQALQKMKTHVSIPERHLLTLDNTKKKATGTDEGGEETKAPLVVPPRSALKLQRNPVKQPNRKIDKTSPRVVDMKSKRSNLDKLLQYSKLLTTLFDNARDNDERKQLSMKMESNMRSMKSLQEDIQALTHKRTPLQAPLQAPYHYKLNRKVVPGKAADDSAATTPTTPTTTDAPVNNQADDEGKVTAPGDYSRNPFKKVNKPLPPPPPPSTNVQATRTLLKVDRRPRELLVTGFPANEDKLSVLSHMKHYGEIEKSGYIEQPASLLVTYKYRTGAEKAISLGSNYKDTSLKIIWWDNLISKNKNNNINNNNNNNNNAEKKNEDVNKENNNNSNSIQNANNSNKDDASNDYNNNSSSNPDNANNNANNDNKNNNDKSGENSSAPGVTVETSNNDLQSGDTSSSSKKTGGDDNDAKKDRGDNDVKKGGADNGGVGGDDNDAGKGASWLGNYFDDFHQHLDYEEDEAMDEGLLDEEEEEEDGGRSWRR